MNQVGKDMHLVVIGVGLIGGSFARALRQSGQVGRVTGVGRSVANLERARELGIIDHWTHDIGEAVADADLVLVAVPMGGYEQVFKELAGSLPAGALITDAGSTKQHPIEVANRLLPDPSRFVPAHPIAGTEQSGAEASFTELFEGKLCILTPSDVTAPDALSAVEKLWCATGSRTISMDAASHDNFLASVSHLPHMAAFALVNAVHNQTDADDNDPFRFAAGGFRDFTRIASSSPEMWRDIALANKDALGDKITAFQAELSILKDALEKGDGEALLKAFATAKQARDAWLDLHGEEL